MTASVLEKSMSVHDWVWMATVVRWIDGDTVVLDIDRGFHTTQRESVRLLGVNTPELVGEHSGDAAMAKKFSNEMAPAGCAVIIRSHKPDKYGRWLAQVWVCASGKCVSAALLDAKLAVPL